MSSALVVIKLECDLKETQPYHEDQNWVRYRKFTLKTCSLIKYPNNQNIGPCKYWFQLLIFQINYLIDDIDYQTALNWQLTEGELI
jgi:hypothetical protein